MTWEELIHQATITFNESRIEDADLNARYLASFVLGVWTPSELRPYLKQGVSPHQQAEFTAVVGRRLANEPLQYIIGETEFYGLRMYTTPSALIPRSETELLVERALEEAKGRARLRVLDIGTGCGAIALSIAKHKPEAEVIAIDVSPEAIELALKNKERLELSNVNCRTVDVLSDAVYVIGQFDLILSNPPYISTREFEMLSEEVRDFEPRIALTDEGDGLKFYTRIAEICPQILAPGGAVILELSFDTSESVIEIFREASFTQLSLTQDLAGIERILVAKL